MDVISEDGRFEWDGEKALSNFLYHGISFEEATTVFDDMLAQIFEDEDHSSYEERYTMIGHSREERLLFVCYTTRDERMRIISARPATRREKRKYEDDTL